MKKVKLVTIGTLLVGILLSTAAMAQKDKSQRPSPPEVATGKIGKATVTIDYSSPSVKGRKIFGELVPYGKAWRAGANEATVFQTDSEIKVEGKTLAAGKYSLFIVPGENEWEFIFNSQTGQGGITRNGEANFDPAKNILSVKVKPSKSNKASERLVYAVNNKGFVFRWDTAEVPVSIK
ncbi:MAG: DUF2911 domain-containing protein [Bacteroidetes bacterium]|nr:DUF2911 domain-containing protein [Bacteroidota bacterium]